MNPMASLAYGVFLNFLLFYKTLSKIFEVSLSVYNKIEILWISFHDFVMSLYHSWTGELFSNRSIPAIESTTIKCDDDSKDKSNTIL